jgi:hypothetical protein
MNKKPYNNTFSNIQYLRIPYAKIGLKLIKYDIFLKVLKYKVCSRPAGTQFAEAKRLPCNAVRRKQVLKELKQLSSCSQRGERVVMFLHLFVPLWWRGEEPRESTYDIRFFSSNPISSPSMLKNETIVVKMVKKAIWFTYSLHEISCLKASGTSF